MTDEKLYEVLGDIDEKHINNARTYHEAKKPVWVKWVAAAACLCVILIIVFTLIPGTVFRAVKNEINAEGTLPGALQIYPTVMVNNHLYEWRKGAAIVKELPDDIVLYGNITHAEGNTPQNNCEFVSVFDVAGEIYTVENNSDSVYLKITTEWLDNTIVIFDLVE